MEYSQKYQCSQQLARTEMKLLILELREVMLVQCIKRDYKEHMYTASYKKSTCTCSYSAVDENRSIVHVLYHQQEYSDQHLARPSPEFPR